MAIINQEQVEKFNSQLKEKSSSNPVLREISPEALDIAIGQARMEVLGRSFGAATFNIPDDKNPLEYIDFITTNIVNVSIQKFQDLLNQNPDYLSGWIQNKDYFKNSKAYTDLKTITKTEWSRIEDGIFDLEEAQNPEFENKDLNKLTASNLKDILNSTIIQFLKEIGIQRTDRTRGTDDFIISNAKSVFDYLTKSITQSGQNQTPVNPAASNITNQSGAVITPPIQVTETKSTPKEETANIATSPQTILPPQVTSTKVEVNPPIVNTTPPNVSITTEQRNPTVIEKTQSNVTNITNQNLEGPTQKTFGVATGSNILEEQSPLLSLLGNQLGMSSNEIANIFSGGDISTFDKAMSQSFVNPTIITGEQKTTPTEKSNLVTQVGANVQNLIRNKEVTAPVKGPVGNMISQATGMVQKQEEPVTPPVTVPAPSPTLSANTELSEEKIEKSPESPSSGENKNLIGAETKEEGQTIKEEEQRTNAELLRVMREILKVLQGPLIVTDNSHKFS